MVLAKRRKRGWRKGQTPFALAAFCAALLSASGCERHKPSPPAVSDVADKIVLWDDVTDTSYLDWREAAKAYPTDPQYMAALSYGYTLSQRLSLTPEDYIIFDIDQNIQSPLSQQESETTIYAASGGGDVETALNAAEVIWEKQLDVVVLGRCVSACVEYILPAARSIRAYDMPVLAVHGNIGSSLDFMKNGGIFPCKSEKSNLAHLNALEHRMERATRQWERGGHKADFWRKQVEVLGQPKLVKFELENGDCTSIHQFKSQDFWLPTSEDLREYLGLKFEQPLCNDSMKCLENKLPMYFEVGAKVLAGNEPMTVSIPKLN